MAAPIDLVRERATEYSTSPDPVLLKLAPSKLLAVDGAGEPGGPEFQTCIQALYSMAYTVKFDEKRRGHDFRIAPLRGLYELPGRPASAPQRLARLRWTLQIPIPGFVRPAAILRARSEVLARHPGMAVDRVQLRRTPAGRCVQLLHVGPYSAEATNLERLRRFASQAGLRATRRHEEIYLSDPRRVPPARLRTILRKTVRPGARPRR